MATNCCTKMPVLAEGTIPRLAEPCLRFTAVRNGGERQRDRNSLVNGEIKTMNSKMKLAIVVSIIFTAVACNAADLAAKVPAPIADARLSAGKITQTAVIAGGCFWGIQAVFQHVKGVVSATSGYSGGAPRTAEYE